MSSPVPTPWWHPIAHFSRHVLSSAVLFLLLVVVQVSMTLLLNFSMTALQMPIFTKLTLELAERTLVVVDMVIYFLYVSWLAWRAIKEMTQ